MNKHHIVPQSMGWTRNKNNIIKLDETFHINFHKIFWNKTPKEQIEAIINMSQTALTNDIKSEVLKLLTIEELAWYKRECIKRNI